MTDRRPFISRGLAAAATRCTPAVVVLWAVVIGAWIAMAGGLGTLIPLASLCTGRWQAPTVAGWQQIVFIGRAFGLSAIVAGPAVMTVAMMGPLLHGAFVAPRGPSSGGDRSAAAMFLFAAGYLGCWVAASVVLFVTGTMVAGVAAPSFAVAGATMAVLGAWHGSPVRRFCLSRCRTCVAAVEAGRSTGLASVRSGMALGGWCISACWHLMLVPFVVAAHHVGAMLAVTVAILVERHAVPIVHHDHRRPTASIEAMRSPHSGG